MMDESNPEIAAKFDHIERQLDKVEMLLAELLQKLNRLQLARSDILRPLPSYLARR